MKMQFNELRNVGECIGDPLLQFCYITKAMDFSVGDDSI